MAIHRQFEGWSAALVRHGSLRERRQVSPLPETFATAAKRSTLRKSDMSEKAGASE